MELKEKSVEFAYLRDSNLELFRIVVMLLIVAHHYIVNSGIKELIDSQSVTFQSYYLYVLGMWGKTGINCFVLITGYFMCKSNITLRKFLKLLLEVYFYRIMMGVLFILLGYESMTVKNIFYLFLPIRNLNNGFVSAFIIYYLFIPFLNVVVNNITKRNHQCLILLCIIVYCVFAKAGHITLNYVAWFAVLHIIASYLRFYPIPYIKSCKNWGIITVVFIMLSVTSVYILRTFFNGRSVFLFVSDSNAPLALLTGIAAFMFFKNLKVKQSRFINTVAATTFGVVLLIHANCDAMRQWLWKDTLQNTTFFGTPMGWIHPVVSVLVVFAICSFIDYIRIKYIERPLLPVVLKRVEECCLGLKRYI